MKSDEEKYLAEEKNIFKELLGWLVYILIIFGLTYLVITFVGQRTRVTGSSMETLLSFRISIRKIHTILSGLSECRGKPYRLSMGKSTLTDRYSVRSMEQK